jgi:hypothetical protein
VCVTALLWPAQTGAQGRSGQPPASPKEAAPIDLTGYWVAIVTQDWRQRMVTPPKGDYESVPINLAAKAVGDAWDPAKDEAAGEQCRSYGAPAVMRNPGRVHITWQDDQTLKVELDAGEQTRLFHFGAWQSPANAPATWQGESVAQWMSPPGRPMSGSLKVVTTHVRPGYLRKNGVPYSGNVVLTEHWDLFTAPNGELWLTITSTVEDPQYLRMPWLTALHFKKEPDGAKWDPSPCSATW